MTPEFGLWQGMLSDYPLLIVPAVCHSVNLLRGLVILL
jgi:hypothetical protein